MAQGADRRAFRVEIARRSQLAAEEREVPEIRERGRDRLRRVGGARRRERGLEADAGSLEVALLAGEDPDAVQGARPQGRRLVRARREHALERTATLREVAVDRPEPAQRDGEPERRMPVAGVEGEGERGAEVVVLVVEAGEPRDLVGREEP